MIQTSSALAHAAVVHRWAFNNYVDIILFVFDHLPIDYLLPYYLTLFLLTFTHLILST